MDESKNFFKNHTDKRVSEMHERTKTFKAEKLKEKKRKFEGGKIWLELHLSYLDLR